MSSIYVREKFIDFVSTNIGVEKLVDLTGEYRELSELLEAYEIPAMADWVAIDFIGSDEETITVGSTNTQGKYRETGGVSIHVIGFAKLGGYGNILSRAEILRTKLRGRRLDDIIIESVTPPNFQEGATLQFESGWQSATFSISYHCDFDL